MSRRLTAEAEERIADFESRYRNYGCSCCICPPCGYCTDPDNPMNVHEEDEAWEKEPEPIDIMAAVRAVCEGGAA